MKPHFMIFKTFDEMPLWKVIIWRMFGKLEIGKFEGTTVEAYTFMRKTLIYKCYNDEQEYNFFNRKWGQE